MQSAGVNDLHAANLAITAVCRDMTLTLQELLKGLLRAISCTLSSCEWGRLD